jgi:hypothetical protein
MGFQEFVNLPIRYLRFLTAEVIKEDRMRGVNYVFCEQVKKLIVKLFVTGKENLVLFMWQHLSDQAILLFFYH